MCGSSKKCVAMMVREVIRSIAFIHSNC